MPLTGTNKRCQQCINNCKQWSQVKVVICPKFINKQKVNAKNKIPIPLRLGKKA